MWTPASTSTPRGEGDILHITRKMQSGRRVVTMDDDDSVPLPFRSVTAETMTSYPLSYTVEQTGYHPKEVALSFDDGPDPKWTPHHPRHPEEVPRRGDVLL